MIGGHELVFGIERNFGDPRVGPPGLLGVDAQLGGQHHQRCLCRVADHRPVVRDRRVAVQYQPQRQSAEIGDRRVRDRQDLAGLAVAGALDGEPGSVRVDGGNHHLVHGQGAGLVGVDRTGCAECLHIGEVLHHGLGRGQLLRAVGQHPGNERRQPRRDRRDRHRSTQKQQFLGRDTPHQPDDYDESHCGPGDDAQHPGQRVQLLLQRRPSPGDRRQHRGDLPHLGVHAGSGDHHRRCAPGHRSVLEQHVRPVAERNIAGREGSAVLGHGCAFPGERGFLRLQSRGPDDPPVCRNDVTSLDLDQVTGHHFDRRDQDQTSFADHLRLRDLQIRQRIHAGPGLQLLTRRQNHVQQDQKADDDACRDLPDHETHRCHHDQHDVHRISQLGQRNNQDRRRLLPFDLVATVSRQAGRGLGAGQTARQVGPQGRRDIDRLADIWLGRVPVRTGTRIVGRIAAHDGHLTFTNRQNLPAAVEPAAAPVTTRMSTGREREHRARRPPVKPRASTLTQNLADCTRGASAGRNVRTRSLLSSANSTGTRSAITPEPVQTCRIAGRIDDVSTGGRWRC